MSRMVSLDNGAAIKVDVVESFDKAVVLDENLEAGENFWNYVSADMHMDLSCFYTSDYIDACFDKLAEEYAPYLNDWTKAELIEAGYLANV